MELNGRYTVPKVSVTTCRKITSFLEDNFASRKKRESTFKYDTTPRIPHNFSIFATMNKSQVLPSQLRQGMHQLLVCRSQLILSNISGQHKMAMSTPSQTARLITHNLLTHNYSKYNWFTNNLCNTHLLWWHLAFICNTSYSERATRLRTTLEHRSQLFSAKDNLPKQPFEVHVQDQDHRDHVWNDSSPSDSLAQAVPFKLSVPSRWNQYIICLAIDLLHTPQFDFAFVELRSWVQSLLVVSICMGSHGWFWSSLGFLYRWNGDYGASGEITTNQTFVNEYAVR
jgi:hypothetical protein